MYDPLKDLWTILRRMQMPNFTPSEWAAFDRLKAHFEPNSVEPSRFTDPTTKDTKDA